LPASRDAISFLYFDCIIRDGEKESSNGMIGLEEDESTDEKVQEILH
jgi:hypothetical protein